MSDSGGSRHQCLLVSLFDRSRKVITAAGMRGQAVRPPPAWATESTGTQSAEADANGCWSAGCARALVVREHTATGTDGDGVETASYGQSSYHEHACPLAGVGACGRRAPPAL